MAQELSQADVLAVTENTIKLIREHIGAVRLVQVDGGALAFVLPRTVNHCPRCRHLRMADAVTSTGDCAYCEAPEAVTVHAPGGNGGKPHGVVK